MTPRINILLIEDDKSICTFITTALENGNYRVTSTPNGKEGLSLAASLCPDVILLDLGLPDIDGMEVLTKLRTWTSNPIIVISARTKEQEKVNALDAGADDYLTKPFGTSELMARIRTALRHSRPNTHARIMNAIWGPYIDNNNQILRVNMANIRRKIEKNPAQPQYVFTEIGIGYRMLESEA